MDYLFHNYCSNTLKFNYNTSNSYYLLQKINFHNMRFLKRKYKRKNIIIVYSHHCILRGLGGLMSKFMYLTYCEFALPMCDGYLLLAQFAWFGYRIKLRSLSAYNVNYVLNMKSWTMLRNPICLTTCVNQSQ